MSRLRPRQIAQEGATDGQALVWDDTLDMWLPGAGGGDAALIAEQVLTGSVASVTFSSIPATFRHLLLLANARTDRALATDGCTLRFNGDTGANYYDQYFDAINATLTAGADVAQTNAYCGRMLGGTAPAGFGSAIQILIPHYAGTTLQKTALAFSSCSSGNALADQRLTNTSIRWADTAAISSLTVFGVGNLVAGSAISLYGLK